MPSRCCARAHNSPQPQPTHTGTVQHTEHDVLEQSSAAVAAQEAARLLEAKRRHDDLWKRVQRDASDFGSWTALIDTVLKMVCCLRGGFVVCCEVDDLSMSVYIAW